MKASFLIITALLFSVHAAGLGSFAPYAHLPLHHTVSRRHRNHDDAVASGVLREMVSRRFGTFPHLFAHSRDNDREIKHSYEGVDATGHVVQSRIHAITRKDLYLLDFYPEVTRLQCDGPSVLVTVTDVSVSEAWEVGGMVISGHRLVCEDDGPTTIRVGTEKGEQDPIEVPEDLRLPMHRIIRHKSVRSATQVVLVTESAHFLDAFEHAAISRRVFSPHHALRRHVPHEEDEEFARSRLLLRNHTVEAGLDHDFVFAPHHAHVHHMHWGKDVLCQGCPPGHMPSPKHMRPGAGREATTPAHLRRRSGVDETARHSKWAKKYGTTRWKRSDRDWFTHDDSSEFPVHVLRARELHGSPVFLDMTPGGEGVLWDDDDDDADDENMASGASSLALDPGIRRADVDWANGWRDPDVARFARLSLSRKRLGDWDTKKFRAKESKTTGWNWNDSIEEASIPVLNFTGTAKATSADHSSASLEGDIALFGHNIMLPAKQSGGEVALADPLKFRYSPVPVPPWMQSMLSGGREIDMSMDISCESCFSKVTHTLEFDYIKTNTGGKRIREAVVTHSREHAFSLHFDVKGNVVFASPPLKRNEDYSKPLFPIEIEELIVPSVVLFQFKLGAEFNVEAGLSGGVKYGFDLHSKKHTMAFRATISEGSSSLRRVDQIAAIGESSSKNFTFSVSTDNGDMFTFGAALTLTPGIRVILSLAKVPYTDYSGLDMVLQVEVPIELSTHFVPQLDPTSSCCTENEGKCEPNPRQFIKQEVDLKIVAKITVFAALFASYSDVNRIAYFAKRHSSKSHAYLAAYKSDQKLKDSELHDLAWVDAKDRAAGLGPFEFDIVPSDWVISKEDLNAAMERFLEKLTGNKGGCWGPYGLSVEHEECFNKNGIIAQCKEKQENSASWSNAKFCKALEHNGVFAKSGEDPGKAACVTLMGSTCEEQCTTISPLFNGPGTVTMSACHACLEDEVCDLAKDPGGRVAATLSGCEASTPKYEQPSIENMNELVQNLTRNESNTFINRFDEGAFGSDLKLAP